MSLSADCILYLAQSSGKGGAKNTLTDAQNKELESMLYEYYTILDEANVISLPLKKHLPASCFAFINEKIDTLLNSPAYAGLDTQQQLMAIKVKVILVIL